MTQLIHVLCEECWQEVDAELCVKRETRNVRGVSVAGDFEYLICPKCGISIGWAPLADRNFDKAYRLYRDALDIPQPEDIVALRKRYGFTQKVFAAVLGIGVASLQRYEWGSLATDAHAQLLRNARDPRFLKKRLLDDVIGLDKAAREKALASVEAAFERIDYAVVRFDVLDSIPCAVCASSGMRPFNADRLRETLVYLASHAHDLYRTKLNKVLFYLDFAAYRDEGKGFTGLRYAKADFGPVPDQYELILAALVDGRSLALHEKGEGQVLVALRDANMECFTDDDAARLDAVCAFADGFETASALSAFSHGEPAWTEAASGELLDYANAAHLQWRKG